MKQEDIIKFLELVKATNIKIRNDWVMCSCLFKADHPKGTDRKPSFGISISNPSYYHCFTCNRKGLLVEIQPLLRYYHLDETGQAYNFIREHENFEFKLVEHTTPKTSGIVPYYQYEKYQRPQKSYLNIPVELYEVWDIREHSEYIFIPIFDRFQRLVEIKIRKKDGGTIFGSKCVYPNENFYKDLQRINGVGAKSAGVWYGMHRELNPNKPLFLVEGERDAILLSQYFPNVWASMGASLTQAQINSLFSVDVPIVLFFDNDDAGIQTRDKIKTKLEHKELYLIKNYYNCKDPAEIIEKMLLKKVLYCIDNA